MLWLLFDMKFYRMIQMMHRKDLFEEDSGSICQYFFASTKLKPHKYRPEPPSCNLLGTTIKSMCPMDVYDRPDHRDSACFIMRFSQYCICHDITSIWSKMFSFGSRVTVLMNEERSQKAL